VNVAKIGSKAGKILAGREREGREIERQRGEIERKTDRQRNNER
jgi:hypothetical protein